MVVVVVWEVGVCVCGGVFQVEGDRVHNGITWVVCSSIFKYLLLKLLWQILVVFYRASNM